MIDKIENAVVKYRKYFVPIALAAISIFYFMQIDNVFDFEGGDNAYYVLLAKSIASGQGYRDIFLPGAPAHTQYPPMFPLLLAAVIAAAGINVFLMKAIVLLSAVGSIIVFYFLSSSDNFKWPLACTVWLGCLYRFYFLSDSILTEYTYMFFSLSSLFAVEHFFKNGKKRSAITAILACWAAIITRSIGITLVFAIGAAAFFSTGKSRKAAVRAAIVSAICFLPGALWALRNALSAQKASSYISQFMLLDPYNPAKGEIGIYSLIVRSSQIIQNRLADMAGLYAADYAYFPRSVAIMIAGIVTVAIVTGFVVRCRKNFGVCEFYTVFYTATVFAWPFPGYRFMLPIYPLYIAYAAIGLDFAFEKIKSKNKTYGKIAIAILAVGYFLAISNNINNIFIRLNKARDLKNRFIVKVDDHLSFLPPNESYQRLLSASNWLARNTSSDAVVMSRKNTLVALVSERKVVGVPLDIPPDPRKWLEENGVNFILADEILDSVPLFINALIEHEGSSDSLGIVYKDNNTMIIEFENSP